MANDLDETHPSNPEEDPLADTKPNKRQPEDLGLTQPSQAASPDPSLTQPSTIDPDTKPGSDKIKPPSSKGLWIGMLASFGVALILITIIAGRLGYGHGQEIIKAQEAITSRVYLEQQYQLGLQYMEEGNYFLAMQFFEYIYQQDPTFDKAYDRWVELQVIVNSTATPTTRAQATVTPTQDPRPKEELFDQALGFILAQNWSQALDTISALRQTDLAFRGAEVDGMIYLALRNRGVDKVLNQGDLEGGLYDFTLAEQFGPIDRDAEIYRTWARLYLQGNGFWIAYPGIAAEYYGQVAAAAPGLHDSSGMSAFFRYWSSLIQYGDQLVEAGDWCGAMTAYNTAMNARPDNAVLPTAVVAENHCIRLTISPTPNVSATPTGTGTIFVFTSTSTATNIPGVTATQTPTNTGGPPLNSPTSTIPLPSSTTTPVPSPTSTPVPTNTP